jgi:hypothetical protein
MMHTSSDNIKPLNRISRKKKSSLSRIVFNQKKSDRSAYSVEVNRHPTQQDEIALQPTNTTEYLVFCSEASIFRRTMHCYNMLGEIAEPCVTFHKLLILSIA